MATGEKSKDRPVQKPVQKPPQGSDSDIDRDEAVHALKLQARSRKGKVTIAEKAFYKALDAFRKAPTAFASNECRVLFKTLSEKVDNYEDIIDQLIAADDPDAVQDWLHKQQDVQDVLDRARSILSEAYGDLGPPAPAAPAAGPSTSTRVIDDTIKPGQLSLQHRPIELRQWIRKVEAFVRINAIDAMAPSEQQSYCREFLDTDLDTRISLLLDDYTVACTDPNSIVALVVREFGIKYPLFERRMEYFRLTQSPGQSASNCLAKKVQLGFEADLSSLQSDDWNTFSFLAGLRDDKLLTKLLEMRNPSFDDIKARIASYEATKASRQACHSTVKAQAQAVSNDHRSPGGKPMVTPWSLNGLCSRCASNKHTSQNCDRGPLVCRKCGKKGHSSPACLQDYFKSRANQERKQNQPMSQQQQQSRPNSLQRAQQTLQQFEQQLLEQHPAAPAVPQPRSQDNIQVSSSDPAPIAHVSNFPQLEYTPDQVREVQTALQRI